MSKRGSYSHHTGEAEVISWVSSEENEIRDADWEALDEVARKDFKAALKEVWPGSDRATARAAASDRWLNVSEKTVLNWMDGTTSPSLSRVYRVQKLLLQKRAKLAGKRAVGAIFGFGGNDSVAGG